VARKNPLESANGATDNEEAAHDREDRLAVVKDRPQLFGHSQEQAGSFEN
jgi:hypothetical protein